MTHPRPRLHRREVLRVGSLTALGLSLAGYLGMRAHAKEPGPGEKRPKNAAKACILIWLEGGPSHLDMFDLKPLAPQEVRGPFKPIETNVPGIEICEYLPQTARQMEKVAVIRSLTSTLGEHNFGAHYLLTGYKPTPVLEYPSYGAVVAQHCKSDRALPPYIAVPDFVAQAGGGFLPINCRPFAVGGDPAKPDFRVRDLNPYPGLDESRLTRRREFLSAVERFAAPTVIPAQAGNQREPRERFDEVGAASRAAPAPSPARLAGPTKGERLGNRDPSADTPPVSDPQFEQAYRLIASPEAKRAFDLSSEPAAVRQRYGPRTLGQSCLLARRLVESGVPFVTVTDHGWDTHDGLFNRLKEGYTGGSMGKIPILDLAYSALLEDLASRGLLDSTLVILMGEFGRTPKLNTSGGRDHWPRVFSALLAGGGVIGAQAVGASDAHGESPASRPVLPEDLARTIYTLLGVNPDDTLVTSDGRPVSVNQGGSLVREIVG